MRSNYLREHTFENLIFGPENETAIQQLRDLVIAGRAVAPIYIHAACGNGTTAVGNALINAIPDQSACWIPAEVFINKKRENRIRPYEAELLDYGALFFDNPSFLIGRESDEAALAEVITKALARDHWIILGDSMPPQELAEQSPKLNPIVLVARVVKLEVPSPQTRRRFIQAVHQEHDGELPEAEVKGLVESCMTYRELKGQLLYAMALKRLEKCRNP